MINIQRLVVYTFFLIFSLLRSWPENTEKVENKKKSCFVGYECDCVCGDVLTLKRKKKSNIAKLLSVFIFWTRDNLQTHPRFVWRAEPSPKIVRNTNNNNTSAEFQRTSAFWRCNKQTEKKTSENSPITQLHAIVCAQSMRVQVS